MKIYTNKNVRNDPVKKCKSRRQITLHISLVDIEFAKFTELHQKRSSKPTTPANQLEDHHRGLFRWNVCYVLCCQTGARIASPSMKI